MKGNRDMNIEVRRCAKCGMTDVFDKVECSKCGTLFTEACAPRSIPTPAPPVPMGKQIGRVEAAYSETHKSTNLAAILMMLGVGYFVLPAFGYQFSVMQALGAAGAIGAVIFIITGAVLQFRAMSIIARAHELNRQLAELGATQTELLKEEMQQHGLALKIIPPLVLGCAVVLALSGSIIRTLGDSLSTLILGFAGLAGPVTLLLFFVSLRKYLKAKKRLALSN
jgi:hypothetical protein